MESDTDTSSLISGLAVQLAMDQEPIIEDVMTAMATKLIIKEIHVRSVVDQVLT